MLESAYPYTSGAAGDDSTECNYSASDATKVKVKRVNYYPKKSLIVTALSKQPVNVAIAANNKYIHSYLSGVIDATDCFETDDDWNPLNPLNPVNHAVLLVGYGHDEATGLDYWLVKNSWNATWGDQGYFKVKRADDTIYDIGICGI